MRFYVKRKRTPQIIIVSLIDIFAILLIFFIVTTTFKTTQTQLAIKLPESKSATQSQNPVEPAIIEIAEVGSGQQIQFEGKTLSLDELKTALQEFQSKSPGKPLAMKADRDVPFGFMVQVLDTLKESGLKSVPAFTQPKERK
ncbi:MAG: biopolymer transporter ExbD [Verrucomicrobia bacterium]|nr:biopolymer transporter ExbD [Verrucomicrobiota bacterium]